MLFLAVFKYGQMVFLVLYLFPHLFDIWETVNAKLKWLSVCLKRCLRLRIIQLVLFFWSREISIRNSPSCILFVLHWLKFNLISVFGSTIFFALYIFSLSVRFLGIFPPLCSITTSNSLILRFFVCGFVCYVFYFFLCLFRPKLGPFNIWNIQWLRCIMRGILIQCSKHFGFHPSFRFLWVVYCLCVYALNMKKKIVYKKKGVKITLGNGSQFIRWLFNNVLAAFRLYFLLFFQSSSSSSLSQFSMYNDKRK